MEATKRGELNARPNAPSILVCVKYEKRAECARRCGLLDEIRAHSQSRFLPLLDVPGWWSVDSKVVTTVAFGEVDVAIVGGGCAGLFTALELSKSGFACAVIDRSPLASYSSTRNQGWLQSGALYAALGQNEVAKDCAKGFETLSATYPEAIDKKTRCYFLFRTKDELGNAIAACDGLEIFAIERKLSWLTSQEPILVGTPFVGALEVEDRPFNTNAVLTRVATEAVSLGTKCCSVSDLSEIQLNRTDGSWMVAFNEISLRAQIILLAAGAYIKRQLQQFGSSRAKDLVVQKIPVYCLHGPVTSSMLVSPLARDAPNLVPFSVGGKRGATICLTKADVMAASSADFELPPSAYDQFVDFLEFWFPGIVEHAEVQLSMKCHAYVCQKIHLEGDASRRHFIIDHNLSDGDRLKNLFTFYPGKFTASPLAAEDCAKIIGGLLSGRPPCVGQNQGANPVEVAKQRFLGEATHRLRAPAGDLELTPLV